MLEKLRGTTEVDAEFADIVAAVEIARPITMRQVSGGSAGLTAQTGHIST